MWPCRLTLMTYNLWNDCEWDRREPAAAAFFGHNQPDILGVQELRGVTRDFLDAALPDHRRVDDPLPGWTCEGNLWWHGERFDLVDHGAEPVGHLEPHRRLFWVRLQPRWAGARELLVANTHFTWVGNPIEANGGISPRFAQAQATVTALDRLRRDGQPAVLMGDLNDFANPIAVLRAGGYVPAGEPIGRPQKVTWPAMFVLNDAPQAIDWVLTKGPIRALTHEVLDFRLDGVPPSDHMPVQVVFELGE